MSISDTFRSFLTNIKITNESVTQISNRYQQITKALNQNFRCNDSSFTSR